MSTKARNLVVGSSVLLAVVAVGAAALWQYQRNQAASTAFMQRFAEKRRELALDRDRLSARFDQRMGGLDDLNGRLVSRAARAQLNNSSAPPPPAAVRKAGGSSPQTPSVSTPGAALAAPEINADPLYGIPDEEPRPKRRRR